MTAFKEIIRGSSFSAFDPSARIRKELISFAKAKSICVKFYSRLGNPLEKEDIAYFSSDEVAQWSEEVTMLCSRSLINLIVKYPYHSKYVLAEINLFSPYFYFGMLGLIRRIFLGIKSNQTRISLVRIEKFSPRGPYFALVKNPYPTSSRHYTLSESVGYQGFLEFLNSSDLRYVVLRFFERLPQQYRDGGDLDILVEDKLESIASQFLISNPGSLKVDLYSVSGPASSSRVPYHTPFISKRILDEAATHKGFKVPSNENYLYSFIYHCLYHKGLSSGIPSSYKNLRSNKIPENDYLSKITELSVRIGVSTGSTLEELDKFMGTIGWRPHSDTLELLSSSNRWLAHHINCEKKHKELAMILCVLKDGFYDRNNINEFESKVCSLGFKILSREHLQGTRKELAANHLRGGNWSLTENSKCLPSDVFVLLDTSVYGTFCRKYNGAYNPRPKKYRLRRMFDFHTDSMIHMTDTTHQSVEYLEVLYPTSLDNYLDKVAKHSESAETKSLVLPVRISIYLRLALWNIPSTAKKFLRRFL